MIIISISYSNLYYNQPRENNRGGADAREGSEENNG